MILILSFAIFSQCTPAANRASVDAVATLNGVTISNAVIDRNINLNMQQIKKDFIAPIN